MLYLVDISKFKEKQIKACAQVIGVLLLIVSFCPVLFKTQLMNPDAHVVVYYLENLKDFGTYFRDLLYFQTVDLQPLRDLSLYVDVLTFRVFHINTSIWQNLIIWFFGLLVVERILKKVSSASDFVRWFVVVLFGIYPLFGSALLWGVARKHLLAFLFIGLATNAIMDLRTSRKLKNVLWALLFFVMSLLSQPINILWPVWAIFYLRKLRREAKVAALIFSPVTAFFGVANYFYYRDSAIFLLNYNSKTFSPYSLLEKAMAIGLYVEHLFTPFNLTYMYNFSNERALIGVWLLVLLFIGIMKYRKRLNLEWLLFALLPIVLMSSNPTVISDTYLLVPALGFLLFFFTLSEKISDHLKRNLIKAGLGLIPVFVFLNISFALSWRSDVRFTEYAFDNQPSCQNAAVSARIGFERDGKVRKDIYQYVLENKCYMTHTSWPSETRRKQAELLSMMVFYGEGKQEEKEEVLGELSNQFAYPRLVLAALLIKSHQESKGLELFKTLKREHLLPPGAKDYDKIAAEVIYPYCSKINDLYCLSIVKDMSENIERTWF